MTNKGSIRPRRRYDLSSYEIKRVITLLKESELTLVQIAKRLDVSKGAIQVINEREGIRDYTGHRVHFKGGING